MSPSRAPRCRRPGPRAVRVLDLSPTPCCPERANSQKPRVVALDGPGGTTVPRVEEELSPGMKGAEASRAPRPRAGGERPAGISRRKLALPFAAAGLSFLPFPFSQTRCFPVGV